MGAGSSTSGLTLTASRPWTPAAPVASPAGGAVGAASSVVRGAVAGASSPWGGASSEWSSPGAPGAAMGPSSAAVVSSPGAASAPVGLFEAAGLPISACRAGSVTSSADGSVGRSSSPDDKRLTSPALGHVLVLDALLEQHDALEQGLGPGRAARHVDVDGDELVDALGHGVGVPVGAAAVGAAAHGDDVLGPGHLLPEPDHGGAHLVGDGARDDDQVRLAGAGRQRDHAEAHHVVAGRAEGGAHLDGAAGQAPLVHPEGVLAAHVEEGGEGLRDPPVLH